MIVVIVLVAILMAMAAPLIAHLATSYETDAAGAGLAAAPGPALWQINWDARNSNHMAVNTGTSSCVLILRQSPSNAKIKYIYHYALGEIDQKLPGATPVLLLAHLTVPGGGCPFTLKNQDLVFYDWQYQGASGQGHVTLEGLLTAYARP